LTNGERSFHVQLALKAIDAYVSSRRVIHPPPDVPEELCGRAGCFVSLKKFGQLRGCIGTIEPTQATVGYEIVHCGINAATRDPRFDPVKPDELADLVCSVDVLMPPEAIADACELDPYKFGVIVESGYKRGLLLPNLDGVDTVDYQLEIVRRKACILPSDVCQLYRFEVKRYY
jgi:AmmeMemoRadiSam system protein A